MKSAKERSLFAYVSDIHTRLLSSGLTEQYLGMNAASSVKRMGDDACKELDTATLFHTRAGLRNGPVSASFAVFLVAQHLLFVHDQPYANGRELNSSSRSHSQDASCLSILFSSKTTEDRQKAQILCS